MLQIREDYNSPAFSQGDMSNPLVVSLDATYEAVQVRKFLLHNDDPLKIYRNITLQIPIGQTPPGWSIKLLYQSLIPTAADWLAISSGNLLSVPDILDLNYYPIWLSIQVPAGASVQTIIGPRLLINFTEQPL
jgi:hypothetical protein